MRNKPATIYVSNLVPEDPELYSFWIERNPDTGKPSLSFYDGDDWRELKLGKKVPVEVVDYGWQPVTQRGPAEVRRSYPDK